MEDALVREWRCFKKANLIKVLILVLMEDALVQVTQGMNGYPRGSLNPCFNGRCTRTEKVGV